MLIDRLFENDYETIKKKDVEYLKTLLKDNSSMKIRTFIQEVQQSSGRDFNKTINRINVQLKILNENISLEQVSDNIHQIMETPFLLTINPKEPVNSREFLQDVHNIMRRYFSKVYGKRWYKKSLPNFYVFEERGKIKEIEEHFHLHMIIDMELSDLHGLVQHIQNCFMEYGYKKIKSKYKDLSIDVKEIYNDGIFAYLTKEDRKEIKKGENNPNRIYDKNSFLFTKFN